MIQSLLNCIPHELCETAKSEEVLTETHAVKIETLHKFLLVLIQLSLKRKKERNSLTSEKLFPSTYLQALLVSNTVFQTIKERYI